MVLIYCTSDDWTANLFLIVFLCINCVFLQNAITVLLLDGADLLYFWWLNCYLTYHRLSVHYPLQAALVMFETGNISKPVVQGIIMFGICGWVPIGIDVFSLNGAVSSIYHRAIWGLSARTASPSFAGQMGLVQSIQSHPHLKPPNFVSLGSGSDCHTTQHNTHSLDT